MRSDQRFSDRVSDYVRFRPGYPPAMFDALADRLGIQPDWVVADIGSGTGILAAEWLRRGHLVYGIEPNDPMREAAEAQLAGRANFINIAGSAENTGLPARSANLVTAAQSFHWFHRERARREFVRILKPGGWVILIWNDRRPDATPFLRAYEQVLETHAIDYTEVNHRHVDTQAIASWFAPDTVDSMCFTHAQHFDWNGLLGRAMSCSYVPGPGHARHDGFVQALRTAFDSHAQDGHIAFEYDTRVYYGHLH